MIFTIKQVSICITEMNTFNSAITLSKTYTCVKVNLPIIKKYCSSIQQREDGKVLQYMLNYIYD